MFQNISDVQVSASAAAGSIVSQLQAFGRETLEPIHILDAYNKVAADFAVGTNDLSKALELSGAGMAIYNNTFEETIGLVTAGSEILVGRSSQVARGLNTIAANIVEHSGDLAKYGIVVKEANGELKSTYDVLSELKPKWDAMTDAERQALGVTLAGKNQFRVLAAIMTNFDHAIGATEDAMNSSGTAISQNTAYMEGLEAQTNLLKADFQDLANNVISKDLISAFLNLGKTVLEFANTGLGQVLTKTLLLTGIGWGATSLIHATKIIPTVIGQFKNFASVLQSTAIGAGSFAESMSAFGGFAGNALPIILGLTVATVGIVEGIKALSRALDPIYQLQKGLKEIKEIQSEISKQDDLISLINQYTELRNKVTLTVDEEKQLIDVRKQLADATNGLISENDDFSDSLDKTVELVKEEAENQKFALATRQYTRLLDIQDDYNKALTEQVDIEKKIDSLRQARDIARTQWGDMTYYDQAVENIATFIKNVSSDTLVEGTQAYDDALEKIRIDIIALTGSYIDHIDSLDQLKGYYLQLQDTTGETANKVNWELKKSFLGLQNQVEQFTTKLTETNSLTKEYEDTVVELYQYTDSTGQKFLTIDQAVQLLGGDFSRLQQVTLRYNKEHQQTVEISDKATQTLSENAEALQQQLEKLTPLKDAFDVLSDALKDVTDKGSVSTKTLGNLQEKFSDVEDLDTYINAILDARDDTDKLKQALIELGNAKINTADNADILNTASSNLIGVIENETGVTLQARQAFIDLGLSMFEANATKLDFSSQVDQLYSLALAAGIANAQMKAISNQGYDYEEAEALGMSVDEYMIYRLKQTIQNAAQYSNWGAKITDVALPSDKVTNSKTTGDRTGTEKTVSKITNEDIEKYKQLVSLRESEYELAEKQGASTAELKEKAEAVQEALHLQAEEYRKLINNAEALGLSEKEIDEVLTNINQLSASWYEWQEKINPLYEDLTRTFNELIESDLDKEREAIEALQDRMVDYYDEQIQGIDDQISAIEEANKALQKQIELEEKLDALARAKQQKVLVYKNGSWQYVSDTDAVSKATVDVNDYLKQQEMEKQIEALNKEKTLLQDFKDSWQNMVKAYKTAQKDWLIAQELGIDTALDQWQKLIKGVADYAQQYAAITQSLGVARNLGGYSKSYDPNTDYSALILSSSSYDEAKKNAALREAKIAGENLSVIKSTNEFLQDWITAHSYASGTLNSGGGISLVGEKGAELRVLNRGDGILPSGITQNLLAWGQINPMNYDFSPFNNRDKNMNVNIQSINLPNVSNGMEFVEYLKNNLFGQILSYVH